MAKTQVYDSASTVTGTIAVLNQNEYPILVSAPTKLVHVLAGGIKVSILDVSTSLPADASPPFGTQLTFQYSLLVGDAGLPHIEVHGYHYMPSDGWSLSLPFSISTTGRRLTRTQTTTPGAGRSNSPVFAREVSFSDAWSGLPQPWSWAATFGSLSSSGTQEDPPGPFPWRPAGIGAISGVGINFTQHKGTSFLEYANVTGLQWDGAALDFSPYEAGSQTGLNCYLDGIAGGMRLLANVTGDYSFAVAYNEPHIFGFSQFGVWDRDQALCENLRIAGPFRCSKFFPASTGWSTTP